MLYNKKKGGIHMTYENCITFTIDNWTESLELLKTNYTLPINIACEILRCSREWIARYIRPNVKHIYLDQSAAHLALKTLNYDNCKPQVWFDISDFALFVFDHMSCTRQTILIPVKWLLSEEWQSIEFSAHEDPHFTYSDYSDIGLKIKLTNIDASNRGKFPHIKVPLPEDALSSLLIINDCRSPLINADANASNESVYRQLFKLGAYKVKLEIGKSRKTYFILPDPEQIKEPLALISYADYCKYFSDRN